MAMTWGYGACNSRTISDEKGMDKPSTACTHSSWERGTPVRQLRPRWGADSTCSLLFTPTKKKSRRQPLARLTQHSPCPDTAHPLCPSQHPGTSGGQAGVITAPCGVAEKGITFMGWPKVPGVSEQRHRPCPSAPWAREVSWLSGCLGPVPSAGKQR